MSREHEIEKDWTTAAGLRAVVIVVLRGGYKSHRCGYVGIPTSHPLHGVSYDADATVNLDVHGGLTYSKANAKYPATNDGLWWYGFDCAHLGDAFIEIDPIMPRYFDGGDDVVRSLEYCVDECESLATQIARIK